jgi:glutamine cyclotransferase
MSYSSLLRAAALVALSVAACTGETPPSSDGSAVGVAAVAPAAGPPAWLQVEVLATYPHDPEAFTQGLLIDGGALYESTGRYGRSSLRRVAPETGVVLAERTLSPNLFGEGLARVGERLVQLTWREGVAPVWDLATLEEVDRFSYQGEGWGLTFDGERLLMSDGSSWLVFRDPDTFEELDRVSVTIDGQPLGELNELEWVDGAVWANVWGSSSIVRIDPGSGAVTAVADLSGLQRRLPPEEARGIDVLNGIAWWPERDAFVVTGKLWPRAFLVRLE